jgi:phytoene synthase
MPGSNFFVAFRVLPPEGKRAIKAIYAFCRRADDAADETADSSEAERALTIAAERLADAYSGRSGDAEAEELRWAVESYDLPRRPFEELLEGVSWDIAGRSYADREALREYCYRVASTVGLLCVRIFGCREGKCDAYAREMGIAMQWTNILRDIGEDLARGRIYLPADAMRSHRLTAERLRDADDDSRRRLSDLIRQEAAYAAGCYEEAGRLLPAEDRSRVIAGEIMAAVYRALLDRIESAGADVLDRRIKISALRRVWIAGRILMRRKR